MVITVFKAFFEIRYAEKNRKSSLLRHRKPLAPVFRNIGKTAVFRKTCFFIYTVLTAVNELIHSARNDVLCNVDAVISPCAGGEGVFHYGAFSLVCFKLFFAGFKLFFEDCRSLPPV